MNWDGETVESELDFKQRLIEEVRQYDVLYNKNNKQHNNRMSVANAWVCVSQTLNCSPEYCRTIWQSLCNQFGVVCRRARAKAGTGSFKQPKWIFYHSMLFLRNDLPFDNTSDVPADRSVDEASADDRREVIANDAHKMSFHSSDNSNSEIVRPLPVVVTLSRSRKPETIVQQIQLHSESPDTCRKERNSVTDNPVEEKTAIGLNEDCDMFGRYISSALKTLSGTARGRAIADLQQVLLKHQYGLDS